MAGLPGFTGWLGVVLQSPDPRALASFYERLLGWTVATSGPTWVTMQLRDRRGDLLPANLAFQLDEDHRPPVWPTRGAEQQLQMHLDVEVEDVPAAVDAAVAMGAVLHEHQPQDDVCVLRDPDGHLFCLYTGSDA